MRAYIDILSKNYFIEKTNGLLNHLEGYQALHLYDEIFVRFFENWCEENQIKEYYLVDKEGTLLVIDNKGVSSCFVVTTDKKLDAFMTLYDDEEFFDVQEKIKKDKLIPFFGPHVDPLQVDTALWDKYLYESTLLAGKEKYYWVVVK
jgi:hypothetical protein